ncbi:Detected protein of unknown function [Hibiscus syriacus]|uniref:Uncharacterized protein n=1 Tax=Hibiscus syriacus TaxID=106335 RepID=A0A6A2YB81_HIBSY|nr:Detected protein of unknown function [Hibiscus syriacus]
MEMQEGKMEKDFLFQWGNRKKLRCPNKLKKQHHFGNTTSSSGGGGTSTTPQSLPLPNKKIFSSPVVNHLKINSDLGTNKPRAALTSLEKEDRYYATRGSGSLMLDDNHNNNTKALMDQQGCKLPQRSKKRAKLIQRSILFVSPGTWLSDMYRERYQVREKKTSKNPLTEPNPPSLSVEKRMEKGLSKSPRPTESEYCPNQSL